MGLNRGRPERKAPLSIMAPIFPAISLHDINCYWYRTTLKSGMNFDSVPLFWAQPRVNRTDRFDFSVKGLLISCSPDIIINKYLRYRKRHIRKLVKGKKWWEDFYHFLLLEAPVEGSR